MPGVTNDTPSASGKLEDAVVIGTHLQGGSNCSPMGHSMGQIGRGADNTGAKTKPAHTMIVWQRIGGMVGFR